MSTWTNYGLVGFSIHTNDHKQSFRLLVGMCSSWNCLCVSYLIFLFCGPRTSGDLTPQGVAGRRWGVCVSPNSYFTSATELVWFGVWPDIHWKQGTVSAEGFGILLKVQVEVLLGQGESVWVCLCKCCVYHPLPSQIFVVISVYICFMVTSMGTSLSPLQVWNFPAPRRLRFTH